MKNFTFQLAGDTGIHFYPKNEDNKYIELLLYDIKRKPPKGIIDLIPSLVNLLVIFDPKTTSSQDLIDYVNQLEHPSNIIIGQKVSRIGTKSYDIESAVFKEDNNLLICKSTITSVCYDFINNKTIPIYKEIIDDYHKK